MQLIMNITFSKAKPSRMAWRVGQIHHSVEDFDNPISVIDRKSRQKN